jgi:hypothetical protein
MRFTFTSPFFAAKLALALVLVVCTVAGVEFAWRVYALSQLSDFQRQNPPASAEAVATKAAPLLRAATNAEPLYAIVQSQHVELSTNHELMLGLVTSSQSNAALGLAAFVLVYLLVAFVYVAIVRYEKRNAPTQNAA